MLHDLVKNPVPDLKTMLSFMSNLYVQSLRPVGRLAMCHGNRTIFLLFFVMLSYGCNAGCRRELPKTALLSK